MGDLLGSYIRYGVSNRETSSHLDYASDNELELLSPTITSFFLYLWRVDSASLSPILTSLVFAFGKEKASSFDGICIFLFQLLAGMHLVRRVCSGGLGRQVGCFPIDDILLGNKI